MPWKTSEIRKAKELPITSFSLRELMTESAASPCVDGDDDLRALRPEGVRLELVPEGEAEDDDEQRAADAGGDPPAAPGRGPLVPPAAPPGSSARRPRSPRPPRARHRRRVGGRPARATARAAPALVVGSAHARSSHACSSTIAAALSTTRRAALPAPAGGGQGALGLHRREALVRRLHRDPQRLEQRAQRVGLVQRRPGRRAGLAREAQGQAHHDGGRLDLADGLDHGPAVPRRRRRCARSCPTGSPASARCR